MNDLSAMERGVAPAGQGGLCNGRLKHPTPDGRTTCGKSAGWGTPHRGTGRCTLHLGSTPSHVRHAQEQQARAGSAPRCARHDHRHAAVEHALALAHGQMLYAAQTVAELPAERLVVTDRSGATRVSGQVTFFQDALREYSRQAHDVVQLGLDEQRVQLEERRVEVMIRVLQRVLAELSERTAARLGHELPELAGEIVGPLVHAAILDVGAEVA